MPPKGNTSASGSSKKSGELEQRMMVQQETLAAGALQTFNPSMYTTPFVRSNAKLTPADLNVPVTKGSKAATTSGICMSLPQANDVAVPSVLHSFRQLDVTKDILTLTSADLKRSDEMTVLANVILQTTRRIKKLQLLIGAGAASKIISTIHWPAGQEVESVTNYSLMGCLTGMMLNPSDIEVAIRVFFEELDHHECFDGDNDVLDDRIIRKAKHPRQATLLLVHQHVIAQFIELRGAFFNPDQHPSIVEEFAAHESRAGKDQQSEFINALNRGLGFKATTQEPAELNITASNTDGTVGQASHSIPASLAGRAFAAFWVWIDPIQIDAVQIDTINAPLIESISFLGSELHHSIARDPRKTRGTAGSQHYFMSFTGGALNLSDSSHSALVCVKPKDEISIRFSDSAKLSDLSRVHAYIVWYDLYSLHKNKARCLTVPPPSILTVPKTSESQSSAKGKAKVVEEEPEPSAIISEILEDMSLV